ncbi:MAG: hypothetical protein AB7R90_10900 [Reyranellaceae bacterium]
MRLFLSVMAFAAALALAGTAQAQGVGRLTTKSYQPIGKQKLQVDLTQVDAGELYRELRDHLKGVLERRGNPVGSSGVMGVKIEVSYPRPVQSSPLGHDRGATYDRQETTVPGLSNPIPQERTFAPERRAPQVSGSAGDDERLNPLRINLTVYREKGGAVAWTAEASCAVPFTSAKDVGRAMIDQMVARLDNSVSLAAQCGY